MPKGKDLKRLARTRMQKTGESYTTARAKLLQKKQSQKKATSDQNGRGITTARTAGKPAVPAADLAQLAGMSDEAVHAKTGHSWSEWVRILDAIDAHTLPHSEIATHVNEVHGVSGWWSQAVTVGYERIRGLRDIGQRRGGAYEASKSRTFPVPVAKLCAAFATAKTRARWLPGIDLTVRKATPDKSMRITWPDSSSVEVWFTSKSVAKSQVAVQHRKLASKADVQRMKDFWSERLDALAEILS